MNRLKLDLIHQLMNLILNKLTERDILQTEMFALKAIMERLIQQSEEKERQMDASATTSSFALRASNT